MATDILGAFNYIETPTVNNLPVLLGDGNTPQFSQGLFANIPAAGNAGALYIATDLNKIFRDTGIAWVEVSASAPGTLDVLNSGIIPAATGTSLIPYDNTSPLISEGTQIWSSAIAPSRVGAELIIDCNFVCDSGTNNRNSIAAFFLDNTCIGVSAVRIATAGGPMKNTAKIKTLSTALSHTVSCRVGISSAATWYVNRQATAYFNGLYTNNGYTISEILT